MRKLLALISITSIGFNSGVSGVMLLRNLIDNNSKIVIDIENNINPKPEIDNKNQEKEDFSLFNDIIKIISEKNSAIVKVSKLLPYLNNENLSDDSFVGLLESLLIELKGLVPNVEEYLSYFNLSPIISLLTNELANDWDQQEEYGNSPFDAMKNFINSNQGDIAQAKKSGGKEQWHYVAVRAKNWTWNDFYLYMAGANLNYMFKTLSGNYIGELINKRLHLGPWNWGFDEADFLNDMSSAMQKLVTSKQAWPYLIKTLVPLLKTKVLKSVNPTLAFNNLTWEQRNDKDLSLKTLVAQVRYLLSPAGYNDLVRIFASILTGPFGEDIIINCWSFGYYTFPEILEVVNTWPINWIIGNKLKPVTIAKNIVGEMTKIVNNLNLNSIFDQIISTGDAGIKENPVINLSDLSNDLNKFYQGDNFEIGLNQLTNLINGDDNYELKDILALWGVQKGEKNFRLSSPLFIFKKWVDDKNSILNNILNILINIEEKQ